MELKIIRTKYVTLGDIEFINRLDTYELPERVYDYYIENTNNNEDLTIEECKKKLIRNMLLSYEAPVKKGLEHKMTFYYGFLIIQINMTEKSICYIQNKLDDKHTSYLDEEKRKTLNYVMGIEE